MGNWCTTSHCARLFHNTDFGKQTGDLRMPVAREFAMRQRSDLHAFGHKLDDQLTKLRRLKAEETSLKAELELASKRHNSLLSGKGLLIDSFGPIIVHEFWIQIPGYSGPIKDTSANVVLHGNVQTVGEVTSKQNSGLGGSIVGVALLGPAGAIAGTLLSRKNETKTTMREFDSRKFSCRSTVPDTLGQSSFPLLMSNGLEISGIIFC